MKYYQLLNNKEEFYTFLKWLPENTSEEKYYICLFARKKYNPVIPSDKQCIKRVVTNKKDIEAKILQLETKVGTYKIKDLEIPNNALALYISINPRNLRKACFNTSIAIMRRIEQNQIPNPKSIAMDEIQKAATKRFVTFDIDSKENFNDNCSKLFDILGTYDYDTIETHGGYHLIVDPKKVKNSLWYNNLLSTFEIDQKGDLLSPIPGCCQGDFTPKLRDY